MVISDILNEVLSLNYGAETGKHEVIYIGRTLLTQHTVPGNLITQNMPTLIMQYCNLYWIILTILPVT